MIIAIIIVDLSLVSWQRMQSPRKRGERQRKQRQDKVKAAETS